MQRATGNCDSVAWLGWLAGGLVGWAGRLAAWPVGWLAGRLAGWGILGGLLWGILGGIQSLTFGENNVILRSKGQQDGDATKQRKL